MQSNKFRVKKYAHVVNIFCLVGHGTTKTRANASSLSTLRKLEREEEGNNKEIRPFSLYPPPPPLPGSLQCIEIAQV